MKSGMRWLVLALLMLGCSEDPVPLPSMEGVWDVRIIGLEPGTGQWSLRENNGAVTGTIRFGEYYDSISGTCSPQGDLVLAFSDSEGTYRFVGTVDSDRKEFQGKHAYNGTDYAAFATKR